VTRPSQALRDSRSGDASGTHGGTSLNRERVARQLAGDLDTIVLAALQRRFRVLRHNLYVEVAMDAKAAGIVIQPGWAFPTNISFHVP